MILLRNNISGKRAILFLLILSVIMVLLPMEVTDKCDWLFARVIQPFSRSSLNLCITVKDHFRTTTEADLQTQYEQLNDDYNNLRIQYYNISSELKHERMRNLQIKTVSQSSVLSRMKDRFILATVTGFELKYREIAKLDHGSKDHVNTNQLVLGFSRNLGTRPDINVYQTAVVGKIAPDIGEHSSEMLLLNDPLFQIGVVIKPNPLRKEVWQAEGILEGTESGEMRVNIFSEIPISINPNDVVYAQADVTGMPIEWVLGTVATCVADEENPMTLNITVKPLFDLHDLHHVIIVRDHMEN